VSVQRRSTKKGPRYDVRLRDPDGKVYTRTFESRREARAFETSEKTDRSRGAWIDPRRAETTFGDWAGRWLATPGKRASTLATDESTVRLHLVPALGPRPLGSITPLDVQGLVTAWSGQYAPATVRRMYGVLRAILSAAVAVDLLVRSPCRPRGIHLPAVEAQSRLFVGPDELALLVEAFDPRYGPMVLLAGVAGLRYSECAGLRVCNLDLLRSTVTVAEALTRGARGAPVFGPPKSRAARRTLTIPSWLRDALAEHLAARQLTGADGDRLVFPAPRGGPLSYRNFGDRFWLPACRAAGLEGLGFHDLRRCAASALVAAGVDVRTAQERLGHSDPRMTLGLYARVTPDGDRAAAERLSAHFGSVSTSEHERTAAVGSQPRDGRAMDSSPGPASGPDKPRLRKP